MKLLLVCLALFYSFVLAGQETPNLYAFIVGTDNQGGIGGGVQQDKQLFFANLKTINGILRYKEKIVMLDSESKKSIINKLKSIKSNFKKDIDVIVFYYSGHGKNEDKSNNMPTIITKHDSFNISEVINIISALSPRLSIIITDCCNYAPQRYNNVFDKKLVTPIYAQNIRRLFGERGQIIATSCRYGEFSYVGDTGSYFTTSFWTKFNEIANVNGANWGKIFSEAGVLTQERVRNDKMAQQTPYHNIQLN